MRYTLKEDDLFVLDAIGLAWKCILAIISAISYATFVLLRVNQLALFEAKVLDTILIPAQQQIIIHHHHHHRHCYCYCYFYC